MTPFEILETENFLDWHTLTIGYRRGWCGRNEIIKYAERCVNFSDKMITYPIIDIVTAENYSDDKFGRLLDDMFEPTGNLGNLEPLLLRWRYAFLLSIIQSDSSKRDKRLFIEDVYAEFCHPDDMADLSVYSNSGVDAVEGTKYLIARLHEKIITEIRA